MVRIAFISPEGTPEEARVAALFKRFSYLLPSWCDTVWLSLDENIEVAANCYPAMHNGFVTIQINPDKIQDDQDLEDTVIHEIAHAYTFPDTGWMIETMEGLDMDERVCKVFSRGATQLNEICTTALTQLLKGLDMAKKSCGTKKGAAKPFPPKKGK